jgi:antitoxin CptB
MTERLKKGYLQWRCRRGTKELDVILNNFLDNFYEQLSVTELLDFDALLDAQDTDLWYYLSGKKIAKSEKYNQIIAMINAYNKK